MWLHYVVIIFQIYLFLNYSFCAFQTHVFLCRSEQYADKTANCISHTFQNSQVFTLLIILFSYLHNSWNCLFALFFSLRFWFGCCWCICLLSVIFCHFCIISVINVRVAEKTPIVQIRNNLMPMRTCFKESIVHPMFCILLCQLPVNAYTFLCNFFLLTRNLKKKFNWKLY